MIVTKVMYYFGLTKQFSNIFIIMEHKKPWQKFMDELNPESKLISVYIKLRHAFNREGWSEEDLKNPPYYPQDIMNGYQKMSYLINDLKSELISYFGDIDNQELTDYIISKLKDIDLEIPLENGNIKRDNPRDEDY
jgi:hypothetical protein